MKKWFFCVIDGTDWSWKGTQTKLIVDKLRKKWYNVEFTDFPQYGKKSAWMVEEYLNWKFWTADEVWPYRASIFYAIDRYEASFQINQWLSEWKIVISNRYVSSNMWHQAWKIKDSNEKEKFLNRIEHLEYDIFWIPKPDLNILLYMPPEIWQKLVDNKWKREYIKWKNKDIHEEDINHLKNASECYKNIAKKYNRKIIDSAPNWKLRTIEDIWNELETLIMYNLENKNK